MRNLMWATLAAGAILAGGEAAWASDTVRLGGPAAQAGVDGGTDTFLVHRRGGYGGGFGGRSYYGGGYGGRSYYGGGYGGRSYYGGGYGGRSYYGGYYGRPFVSVGFYGRPYYSGYYRPYYYPSYYPTYYPTYYSQPYYSYDAEYYYPIAGQVQQAATVQGNGSYQSPAPQIFIPHGNSDGTFPYDGDPRNVVPMPSQNNRPNPAPGVLPIDGKLVSLPNEINGGVLPVGLPAPPRVSTPTAPRVTYPAYGDEPIAPAPRKVDR
jgi:hypothetical protein